MIFEADIAIPKNTTQAAPKEVLMPINKGIITKVMVRPRPGHAALAHCVIRYHGDMIAPSTENMDFHGDTFPIDWEDHIPVLQPPFELKIQGWNDDDTYPHTFTIFVVVLPESVLPANTIGQAISLLFRGIIPGRRAPGGQ